MGCEGGVDCGQVERDEGEDGEPEEEDAAGLPFAEALLAEAGDGTELGGDWEVGVENFRR